MVTDYSTTTWKPTLNEHAARDLAAAQKAEAIPEVSINLPGTRLRPQAIGETVRIRNKTLLNGATDDAYRLIGIQVTATQRGTLGTAKLTLEAL